MRHPWNTGGDYLVNVGDALAQEHGDSLVQSPRQEWLPATRSFAVDRMMALIQEDLAVLGIQFDVITSERSLVEDGAVKAALNYLEDRGLVYTGILEPPKGKVPDDWEPRPQTLFRSTGFGDDVDRPLMKSDGSSTYFATDIAYHLDKYRRGFQNMIDVWGADHGGYVKRMQAAVVAVSEGAGQLDVKLCQMVNLLDGGAPVKMSKRAGTFVSLREVVDRVGVGVFRFIMLTRRNDAQLDFDLEKVTEQSRENPVFYVQYAHARCCSVMRHAAVELGEGQVTDECLRSGEFKRLIDSSELDLIKAMAGWPRIVEGAAEAHEPHRVAFYLQDLAALFHMLWNKGKDNAELRFIHLSDPQLTLARLALVRAVQLVIVSGLQVIGVEPVEETSLMPSEFTPESVGSDRSGGGPDAPNHAADWAQKWRLVIGLTVAGLLLTTALVIALEWPFGNGEQSVNSTREVPTIKADNRPLRVRPDDPGGMEVPNRDMLVYRRLEGANEKESVERLLPEPEQPATPPRPISKPEPESEGPPSQGPPLAERLEDTPSATPPVKPVSESVSGATSSPTKSAVVANSEPAATDSLPKVQKAETSNPTVAQPTGVFQIQLAALRSQEQARSFWNQLRGKHAKTLTKLDPTVVQADLGEKGVIYRLRAGPIGSEEEARAVCDALKAHKTDCVIVRPGG